MPNEGEDETAFGEAADRPAAVPDGDAVKADPATMGAVPAACSQCGRVPTYRGCDCEYGSEELELAWATDPTLAGPRMGGDPDAALAKMGIVPSENASGPAAHIGDEVDGPPEAAGGPIPDVLAEIMPAAVDGSQNALAAGTALAAWTPREALLRDLERAREAAATAVSPSTLRSYTRVWGDYEAWCRSRDCELVSDNVSIIGAYLKHFSLEEVSVSSVRVALSALAYFYREKNLPFDVTHPSIRRVMQSIRREKGDRPERAFPIRACDLCAMLWCATWMEALTLTYAWASAERREEVASTRIENLSFGEDDGRRFVEVLIPRSKTDQSGEGQKILIFDAAVPRPNQFEKRGFCLVNMLRRHLGHSYIEVGVEMKPRVPRIEEGWLFPSARTGTHIMPQTIARLAKRLAGQVSHLKPHVADISGHSLRRGWGTTALEEGVPVSVIRERYRHADEKMTLRYLDAVDRKLMSTRDL